VNVAGLVQGIVLVTFPAASTIFTDADEYDLTGSQYGGMFLPQVVMAVAASLLGANLARRFTTKRVYLAGLASSTVSMSLLIVSTLVKSDTAVAYPVLLVATAFLGAGFGLTVPALNVYTGEFHPSAVDRSVLVLNALLGLGTALAPLFVALFVGLGFWWGLPVLSVVLLAGLLYVSFPLPLRSGTTSAGPQSAGSGIPTRFWGFAAFAVLYGICETMNGNWSQLNMTSQVGATTTQASLALTAFWAMVTAGRVLFASIGRWLPARVTFHLLPLVLVGTFTLTALLPEDDPWLGVAVFGLAGLGCSALLPLSLSFGQSALPTMSARVAGGVIAFYQIGYGIAAFGVGPLLDSGRSLSGIYGLTAIVAGVMAVLSFIVARGQGSPAPLSRRAAPGS
jgi:MFS family permease